MKVLIANWVYNWGSTGYIARSLTEELTKKGHKVSIATAEMHGDDDKVKVFTTPKERNFYWRLGRLGLPKFQGSKRAAKRLIAQIEDEQPDVVNIHLLHCHTIHLYYLLNYLGMHDIKTVITNHAEIYYTGNCEHAYECKRWIYCQCKGCPEKKRATGAFVFGNPHHNWKLMQKSIGYFKPDNLYFTAVSPWVKDRFYLSPIMKGFNCEVVLNGLDINVFYPRTKNRDIINRIDTEHYLLHVTASFNPQDEDNVKGGYCLVKLAKAMPEQKFVVVTPNMVKSVQLPNNILVWGEARDQNELAELYSFASLTIIFSRRETFSMVTAESLCCGTPVVGFKAGGPESIAIPEYSKFVKQRDLDGLERAIKEMATKEFNRQIISDLAREKYSSLTMANGYLKVYEQVLKQD